METKEINKGSDFYILEGKYKVQGEILAMKKRCLELRKNTIELFGKVSRHINEYSIDSKAKYENADKNDRLYNIYKTNYETDLQLALYIYFTSPENLRELFTKVLEGNTENINYNPETDKDIEEIITVGVKIFNDFFSVSTSDKKKSKKLKTV